jgi:hypothetical protein
MITIIAIAIWLIIWALTLFHFDKLGGDAGMTWIAPVVLLFIWWFYWILYVFDVLKEDMEGKS